MSHQITKVDLIPNGELSVCNVSQFDNGRVMPFEILENKEAYNIPNDIRVELHCRKPDGNIVTLPSESIADNIVTFLSTTQLTACYGKNICEIALYGPDDYLIGSGNFILEVEKSPTLGGINSTSAIHDLEDQIRDIAEDVIPEILPDYLEDYYTKSEVDELIDNIFPTFTASGPIASFITALTKPLVSVNAPAGATTVTRCGVNLFDALTWVTLGFNSRFYSVSSSQEITIMDNDVSGIGNRLFNVVPNATYSYMSTFPNAIRIFNNNGETISQLTSGTFTAPADGRIAIKFYANSYPTTGKFILVLGSTIPAEFSPYTSNTVLVDEATTLITLSGVNNVFADVGDVTVDYKYMPMPETPTNSNRLLLSSVNSDIIKEKSEIKDQSDIIEDIKRGEENE